MGSHSVTCHPTQVNMLYLNPSPIGWYSIYLPQSDGRLSWPRWLVTYWNNSPARRQSPIPVPFWPSVQKSSVCMYSGTGMILVYLLWQRWDVEAFHRKLSTCSVARYDTRHYCCCCFATFHSELLRVILRSWLGSVVIPCWISEHEVSGLTPNQCTSM